MKLLTNKTYKELTNHIAVLVQQNKDHIEKIAQLEKEKDNVCERFFKLLKNNEALIARQIELGKIISEYEKTPIDKG